MLIDQSTFFRLRYVMSWIVWLLAKAFVILCSPFVIVKIAPRFLTSFIHWYTSGKLERRLGGLWSRYLFRRTRPHFPEYDIRLSGWTLQINSEIKCRNENGDIGHIETKKIRIDVFKKFRSFKSLYSGFDIYLKKSEFTQMSSLTVGLISNEQYQHLPKTGLQCLGPKSVELHSHHLGCLDSILFQTKAIRDLLTNAQEFEPHNLNHIVNEMLKQGIGLKNSQMLLEIFEVLQTLGVPGVKNFLLKAPILRIEQLSPSQIQILRPGSEFRFMAPITYPRRRSPSTEITSPLPPQSVFSLNDVKIVRGNLVIDQNGKYFLWDKSADPSYEMISSHHQYICLNRTVPNEVFIHVPVSGEVFLEKGILLNGRSSKNYYHWLIEYLPRIFSIQKLKVYADYPIIIDDQLPPTMIAALKLLVGDHPIYLLDSSQTLKVSNLIIPSMLTFQPDTLEISPRETFGYPLDELRKMREVILSQVPALLFPKRIYIGRKNQGRSLANSAEINAVVDELGFQFVDPAQLSFEEQVSLFNSAEEILLLAGAANSNSIFCQPHCRIYCIVAERNRWHYAHKILADVSGASFVYVLGHDLIYRGLIRSRYNYMHSNFYLRPKILRRAIEQGRKH